MGFWANLKEENYCMLPFPSNPSIDFESFEITLFAPQATTPEPLARMDATADALMDTTAEKTVDELLNTDSLVLPGDYLKMSQENKPKKNKSLISVTFDLGFKRTKVKKFNEMPIKNGK